MFFCFLLLPLIVIISCLLAQDPFVGVSNLYKKALGEEEQRLLTTFSFKNRFDGFKLELHEFLVLELKKHNALDTFKPNWG